MIRIEHTKEGEIVIMVNGRSVPTPKPGMAIIITPRVDRYETRLDLATPVPPLISPDQRRMDDRRTH